MGGCFMLVWIQSGWLLGSLDFMILFFSFLFFSFFFLSMRRVLRLICLQAFF